jgi:hypothetical protein
MHPDMIVAAQSREPRAQSPEPEPSAQRPEPETSLISDPWGLQQQGRRSARNAGRSGPKPEARSPKSEDDSDQNSNLTPNCTCRGAPGMLVRMKFPLASFTWRKFGLLGASKPQLSGAVPAQ